MLMNVYRSIVESLAAYMRDKYTDSAKERAQRQQEVNDYRLLY